MDESYNTTLTPGMMVGQRYEILRPLRSEIHGQVWLARDQVLDVDVGLKYLANDRPEFERFLEYYRREALWGLKIHHPQVLGVHHLDEGADGVFLIQEPFVGNSLGDLFGHGEHLTLADALYFLEVLAQGLAHGHKQGIEHQNFNPRQVLVSATDGIKIINFAFPAEPGDIAAQPELRAYIPPEVWEGRQISPASNLFSLGVMGYQMLTGRFPFPLQGEGAIPYRLNSPPDHFQEIPEALRPLFNRCFKADPDKRFKSAPEFLSRLTILREKLSPGGGRPDLAKEEAIEPPVAQPDKPRTPLKIMPLEPEVEINPDWQETPPRAASSSWSAANAWVLTQRQHLAEYFGAEPLRRNRRKQVGAAIGGAVGLLLILFGLSTLFAPSGKPQAVVRTAEQNYKEVSPATTPPQTAVQPPVMSAAPSSPATTEPGTTAGPTESKPTEKAASGPAPVLPEPATAIKPTLPAAPLKPEKPAVKPEKILVKPSPKPEKPPQKTATPPVAAKPSPPDTGPKLVATFEKEKTARQKADALTKQGQRAVVKKAKQGSRTVYQVWLTPPAAAPAAKPRTNAKAVQPR